MLSKLLSAVTLERGLWIAAIIAGLFAGVWMGGEEPVTRTEVVRVNSVFEPQQDLATSPLDQLVLWKKPDTTKVRVEDCKVADWYPPLRHYTDEDRPKLDVNLPGFVTMPVVNGEPAVEVTEDYASFQVGDPTTGQMLEFRKKVPEDAWRGKVNGTLVGGPKFLSGSSTFDLTKKTRFGLFTLGAGGGFAVMKGEFAATPVGKIAYDLKLF